MKPAAQVDLVVLLLVIVVDPEEVLMAVQALAVAVLAAIPVMVEARILEAPEELRVVVNRAITLRIHTGVVA